MMRKAIHTTSQRRLGSMLKTIQRKNIRFLSSTTAQETATQEQQQQQQHEQQPSKYVSGTSTHFGFENVAIDEKEGRVRQVFENVAESYDVMNDMMSGGMHRLWKDYFVDLTCIGPMSRMIRQQHQREQSQTTTESAAVAPTAELRCLDVAGGTGDIAFRMIDAAQCAERSKSSGKDCISVTVCDINTEMLRVGERRARSRYGSAIIDETQALQFQQGNAQQLTPDTFPPNTFDIYTISFGLRNVTDVDKGLEQAYQVLKPGGRFLCLEFSHVPNATLQQLYDVYSFNMIPTMGQMIANDRDSYQYLVESIRKFPKQDELQARMDQVGFQSTKYTNLTGGIVAIHEGYKPL